MLPPSSRLPAAVLNPAHRLRQTSPCVASLDPAVLAAELHTASRPLHLYAPRPNSVSSLSDCRHPKPPDLSPHHRHFHRHRCPLPDEYKAHNPAAPSALSAPSRPACHRLPSPPPSLHRTRPKTTPPLVTTTTIGGSRL
ncbi:hypothetical protein HMN09_01094200 [Mycena chlorophos]|uniref:Uncharacterized protein n=1 Tax=Mycena chlorophos TaxID=658473 RepID=A0A8H6SCK7_MYCCL|nr:hypothetical protein HMN09_01094200 [Mycena chlorophos]